MVDKQQPQQAPEPTPQQLHEILLTSMVKAYTTGDQELIGFSRARYQQFWQGHAIVALPPVEEEPVEEKDPPAVARQNDKPKPKAKIGR